MLVALVCAVLDSRNRDHCFHLNQRSLKLEDDYSGILRKLFSDGPFRQDVVVTSHLSLVWQCLEFKPIICETEVIYL